MHNILLRASAAGCAVLSLAACGGGSDEHTASAWDGVRSCLAGKGIVKLDGIPPNGPYQPPELMPLNFGDAPGGWLVADMAGGQRLGVFFYGDAGAAKRAVEDARSPDTRPVGTTGGVIYVFDQQPTSAERALLRSCLDATAGS